jgi:hypothetical protein
MQRVGKGARKILMNFKETILCSFHGVLLINCKSIMEGDESEKKNCYRRE